MIETAKKDYFWNTLGVFLQNLISPLLLVVITRLNGIEASGLFSFAFSVSVVFWAIGMWGGRTFQVSDAKRQFSQISYVVVRIVLSVVMLGGSLAFALLNNYDVYKTNLLVVLVAFKAVESIADSLFGIMQIRGYLYKSGISLTAKMLVGVAVFIGIDLITKDVLLATIGLLLVNLLMLIVFDIGFVKRLYAEKVKFGLQKARHYIKEALRIIRQCSSIAIISVLMLFSLNIPRFFVDKNSPHEIGYFGIIAMPITLLALVVTFILQPNVVNLTILLKNGKVEKFKKLVHKILLFTAGIGLLAVLVIALIGPWAFSLVFGVDFLQYWLALVVVTAGGIANAIVSVMVNILTIMREFKFPLIILVTTNMVMMALCAKFINSGGMTLSIVFFAIINLIQAVMLYFGFRSKLKKGEVCE